MKTVRITKEINFEMAHALYGHDGPCKDIHGHSYKLTVTLRGKPIDDSASPKFGMVMDFADLKRILKSKVTDEFDHAVLVWDQSPFAKMAQDPLYGNIIPVSFQPTCENILLEIVRRVRPELPDGVELASMRLRETATSYAEWQAEDPN
ncbi:MAG: 6-carboxytetrahydropterin synthase [Flavobacteriales bacterium]|nr:6-carboxytetrahydropterin synthase [Flavobacteriales bacterium]MCB9449250.1 6-carboxytetrahydropterin synthase [Flavobacteriales bacterium]